MAIKRLGAQRFAGLLADVASLPVDADLVGLSLMQLILYRNLSLMEPHGKSLL